MIAPPALRAGQPFAPRIGHELEEREGGENQQAEPECAEEEDRGLPPRPAPDGEGDGGPQRGAEDRDEAEGQRQGNADERRQAEPVKQAVVNGEELQPSDRQVEKYQYCPHVSCPLCCFGDTITVNW